MKKKPKKTKEQLKKEELERETRGDDDVFDMDGNINAGRAAMNHNGRIIRKSIKGS